MSPRQIATLCFQVLAVYTMVDAIGEAGMHLRWISRAVGGGAWWARAFGLLGLLTPIIQAGLGVWLWRRAGVVAAWALGHDLQDDPREPGPAGEGLTANVVQAIVLSSLGVWVLIDAVPQVFQFVTSVLATAATDLGQLQQQWDRNILIDGAACVLRLAIGFWLVFGARGIARLLTRLRRIGLEE